MKQNKSNWRKFRKTFQDIHLWLGLTGGIVIFIVCLTGTIYVYNSELVEWASPELYKVNEKRETRMPIDQLISQVENESGAKVSAVSIPANPSKTYILNIKREEKNKNAGSILFVNPYTGTIQGNNKDEGKMKTFMGYMFSLHRWLLLDKIEKPIIKGIENRQLGRYITGTATILFVIGCITGLIIWFPNKIRNWKQGLKIKLTGNWKRINHDLHNTLAFYSLIFLLIMGLTGLQWSFEWYRNGLYKTLGTYKEKPITNTISEKDIHTTTHKNQIEVITGIPQSVNTILLLANKELKYNGNLRVSFPSEKDKTYSVSKSRVGYFAPAASDRLTIHSVTGEIIQKDIFNLKPFNERVAGNIKALHVGNVFGGFTKLLYFIACLIATSLPITGTIIWINKLKKKRKFRNKPVMFLQNSPAVV